MPFFSGKNSTFSLRHSGRPQSPVRCAFSATLILVEKNIGALGISLIA